MAAEQHAGVHGQHAWLETLRGLIHNQAVPATLEEALAPLAALRDRATGRQKIDVGAVLAACEQWLAAPQGAWDPAHWRRTHPDFPVLFAQTIHVYTRQDPNVYKPLAEAMFDPNRAIGPDGQNPGVSADVNACLPFVKLLDVALVEAAIFWGFFSGQVFRGVKFAFPNSAAAPPEHDPEGYFEVGREFHWHEFKSSSTDFNVMYKPWFCGKSGPRTVFAIQSCEGVSVKPFSQYPDEEEVLFRPLAHFRVLASSKELQQADLHPQPPANGGFPDRILLTQLPTFDQMQALRDRATRERRARQAEENAIADRRDAATGRRHAEAERDRLSAELGDRTQELEQARSEAAAAREEVIQAQRAAADAAERSRQDVAARRASEEDQRSAERARVDAEAERDAAKEETRQATEAKESALQAQQAAEQAQQAAVVAQREAEETAAAAAAGRQTAEETLAQQRTEAEDGLMEERARTAALREEKDELIQQHDAALAAESALRQQAEEGLEMTKAEQARLTSEVASKDQQIAEAESKLQSAQAKIEELQQRPKSPPQEKPPSPPSSDGRRACSRFQLDMAGGQFDSCTCGFPKADHADASPRPGPDPPEEGTPPGTPRSPKPDHAQTDSTMMYCKRCAKVFSGEKCPGGHANFMYTKRIPDNVAATPEPEPEPEPEPKV